MLTPEEKEEIIQEATERMLLTIPEVVGTLVANHAALLKINKKFYDTYPEFKDKREIVQNVVEMVEGNHPLLDYDKILEKSVPEIRRRISQVSLLDTESVPKRIPRDYSRIDFDINGEI